MNKNIILIIEWRLLLLSSNLLSSLLHIGNKENLISQKMDIAGNKH